MEDTIQRLISNLSTISNIDIGDKVSTSLEIQKKGWRQGIYRSLSGDNRDKSIASISNTIDTTISLISLLLESQYVNDDSSIRYRHRYQLLYTLIIHLDRSIQGLDNMRSTYHSDIDTLITIREIIYRCKKFISYCSNVLDIHRNEY